MSKDEKKGNASLEYLQCQCSKEQIYNLACTQLSAFPDFPGNLSVGYLPELNHVLRRFAFRDSNERKFASNIRIFKLKPKKQSDLE